MTHSFRDLINSLPPEQQKRIRKRSAELSKEMALQELRQAFRLTQQQMADTLKLNQAGISKIEHQSDILVSTLGRFIEAMGGELRITAHFPQRDIIIKQFEKIASQPENAASVVFNETEKVPA
jgi:transcriptional regulator with XRE-family HTH domain